ncbi:protein kinase domain-containing protein [Pseudonocardia endophytica]|uniref:Protein kinase-like protein n=1 Tax=Pseudonocardia endophytica TaxID=401976 RepID=A0A4R1HP32_PSEEN|nr:protein kinase [Pseudonocardia endophytica]TCK22405.1 protein kinase-like protein [Pseudonocardia endophytica]
MRQGSGESVGNGRYEIGDVIGRGRRSRVHAGYDTVLHRPVALKFLPATDDGPTPRWRAEAAALNRFDHAHLVRLLDGGEVGSEAFLVLPLMTESLAVRLDRRPLRRDHAAAVVLALADALGHVHRAGLAHGAVDADGVLLDPNGRPCWGGLPVSSTGADERADDDLRALAVLAVRCVAGAARGGVAPAAVLDAVRAAAESGRVVGAGRRLEDSLASVVPAPARPADHVAQALRRIRLRGRPGFAAALAAGFAASLLGAIVVEGGGHRPGPDVELGGPGPTTVLADPAGSDLVGSVQSALNRLGALAAEPPTAPAETREPRVARVAEDGDSPDPAPMTRRAAPPAPSPSKQQVDKPRDDAHEPADAQDDEKDGDDRTSRDDDGGGLGLVGDLLTGLL